MRSLFFFLLLLATSLVYANNIMVDNVSLTDQNAGSGTTQVQFDLSWENSWRISVGPANYDAAWVFIKYRVNGNIWRHATISNDGTAGPGDATVQPMDGMGAMIYRSADGSGDVNWQDIQLRWDYDADGVDASAVVDVQVFAIEMVYVPEGEFSLGTNLLDQNNLNGNFFTPSSFFRVPYRVTDESAITVANSQGNLYYDNTEGFSTDDIGDQNGPIPAAFPKGFAAFYSMKYEVSQEQWVVFFNTLTQTQKENNDVTGPTGKNSDEEFARNGISWPDAGNATTTQPNVALNYVPTISTLAYLDWAGLRPLTELEYEKSCRGPLNPVNSEFAWGNGNVSSRDYTLSLEGTPDEAIADPEAGIGNANVDGNLSAPARVGIFAASALTANREETGGSYYGIMELSGNVYERVISVGNPEGRAFDGSHGDGTLSSAGQATVSSWPTTALGIGYRGGSYANGTPFTLVGDRNDAANEITNGNTRLGFRGARTAQ